MSDDGPGALYVALVSTPAYLRGVRRIQYRCAAHRCLLLDAIDTPHGILLHQKRYKYSPELNAKVSNEAGRRANTFDGDNHWMPRTYHLETSALVLSDSEGATLGLTCDHLPAFALRPSWFAADWAAGHAEMRVRPDGSRYSVH